MDDVKTNAPGLYRSPNGALINKDNEALRAYKIKKDKDRRLNKLEEDLVDIKNDMSEIKSLLKGLIK